MRRQKSKTFERIRKRRFQTKAQMEMLGLAIIIILISLAMLFVVRFVILDKPAEYKKQYTQSELASNFISTLLETTNPHCKNLKFREMMQDVAENWPDVGTSCTPGTTKSVLTTDLTQILGDTLVAWNIPYEFNATRNDVDSTRIFTSSNGNCKGAKKTKQFAIPVDVGANTLYVTLAICS